MRMRENQWRLRESKRHKPADKESGRVKRTSAMALNPYTRSVIISYRKTHQYVVAFFSILVQLFGWKWKSSSKLDLTRARVLPAKCNKEEEAREVRMYTGNVLSLIHRSNLDLRDM